MKVTILGCGTSGGVPRIDGHWGDCDPNEPKNRRRRVSIAVEQGGTRVLVDTSPDMREQFLDAGIRDLDAVLYTHDHADHVHGFDELRALAFARRSPVDIWADEATLATLKTRFPYAFETLSRYYRPFVEPHLIDGPFTVGGIDVTPFAQGHGDVGSLGFRFGPVAYSTDLLELPEASFKVLEGVEIWIVDALRPEPHPTHTHLAQTLEWIERLKPARAVLTHMAWQMDYRTLLDELPAGVEPAYDGLVIEV